MAKLQEIIFLNLWVNCEKKVFMFFKLCAKTKKVGLDRAYMTYQPRFKRMVPNLLWKVKTRENLFREFYHLEFILEYKLLKFIIFLFFNRKSLFCQIFWHEGVVKNSLLKSSLADNQQKWTESRSLSKSATDLSGVAYCLGDFVLYSLKAKVALVIFSQFQVD